MKRVVLAVAVAMLAAPSPAEASCGGLYWPGTPAGSTLPPRGVFFVRDSGSGIDPIRWTAGEAISWRETRVSSDVLRVDYDVVPGSSMTFGGGEAPDGYSFDAGWRRPDDEPRVVLHWHQYDSWMCSWADNVVLQIDQPAAAYRARWTYRGTTTEWIDVAQFDRGTHLLEIGKLNCGGSPFDPIELIDGGVLELTAIRSDGSEIAVTNLPRVVSTKGMLRTSSLRPPLLLEVIQPAFAPLEMRFHLGPRLAVVLMLGLAALVAAVQRATGTR